MPEQVSRSSPVERGIFLCGQLVFSGEDGQNMNDGVLSSSQSLTFW